jgi:hypothetical protein
VRNLARADTRCRVGMPSQASRKMGLGLAVHQGRRTMLRKSLLLVPLLGAMALLPGAAFATQPVTQTLNPPPAPFLTCMAVGGGTICQGTRTISYGPEDTGIICGSGATAFDIFDAGTLTQSVIRYYNTEGNATRRIKHEHYTTGEWSNPLNGATVSYTANNVITDVFAVPGDPTSSTETITGEMIVRAGGAPLVIGTGRQVYNFDESELISSAGRNDATTAFFEGDFSVFDDVCATLA